MGHVRGSEISSSARPKSLQPSKSFCRARTHSLKWSAVSGNLVVPFRSFFLLPEVNWIHFDYTLIAAGSVGSSSKSNFRAKFLLLVISVVNFTSCGTKATFVAIHKVRRSWYSTIDLPRIGNLQFRRERERNCNAPLTNGPSIRPTALLRSRSKKYFTFCYMVTWWLKYVCGSGAIENNVRDQGY